jgi:hypothetical protein
MIHNPWFLPFILFHSIVNDKNFCFWRSLR